MVVLPRLAEELALLIKLPVYVVPKFFESLLEFFLESVEGCPYLRHVLLGLFSVLLDLAVGKGK